VAIDEEILPVLVNDVADVDRPLVIVLDDFHVIGDPEIHEQLDYLIERLPHNAHIVVAGHEPPLRLGGLRGMRDLAEVRFADLRFSDEEAGELLNVVHGLELTPGEVTALQRRVEGWVAGLNLAALSLKQGIDGDTVIGGLRRDDRFLVDYLWNEVVLAQPPAVRQFLMRTAILERLTGPLCEAVAERPDAGELLRELERANLFVVPLDSDFVWFRYHHLFQNVLLGQLERLGRGLISDLHRRASTWFADQG
jgi:LuxR family transcriptional regulator, maltose regulon positive regulatory protein